jgi:hypothetical protein
MIAALGITLGFAGLVTHWMVSVVGIGLTIAGVVGWFREVLPHEQHERVPLRPPALRPQPVRVVPRAAALLVPGEQGHRLRLPVEIHPYSAGLWGGLAGGAAMGVLAVLYGLVAYGSIWYPINLLAAVAMPAMAQYSTEQLAALNVGALSVATIAHVIISIFVGLITAGRRCSRVAPACGAASWRRWCGPACCGRRCASSTPARRAHRLALVHRVPDRIRPRLRRRRPRSERIPTMQSLLAARVGMEADRGGEAG